MKPTVPLLFSCLLSPVLAAQALKPAPAAPRIDADIKSPAPVHDPRVRLAPSEPSIAPATRTPTSAPESWQGSTIAPKLDGYADRSATLPDEVLADRPEPGVLWLGAPRWKARFDDAGMTFHPFFGADAPRNFPIHFALAGASVNGAPLELTRRAPAYDGAQVTLPRGALREVYHASLAGLEQTFVFDVLPGARGEIEVAIHVTSELEARPDGAGFEFVGAHGSVAYGAATAIDAIGAHLPLHSVLEGDVLRIRVPAEFVASARLPLTIDPLIGVDETTIATSPNSNPLRDPDIAYLSTTDEYAIAYERYFSAADTDCYLVRCDSAMTPIATTTIDFTADSWNKPKVASNVLASRFLVVSQVSADGSSPFWIGGRMVDGGTGLSGIPFDIARASVPGHSIGDKIQPDVGGDPETVGPTWFTVIWTRVFSANDLDVHMKQVDATGALRTVAPVLIDNSGAFDRDATISPSNGRRPFASQRWAVTWARSVTPTSHDIVCAFVSWDGIVDNNSGLSYGIDYTPTNSAFPSVSSPTDDRNGAREYLFAYQNNGAGGQLDIAGVLTDGVGNNLWSGDLNALEGGGSYQAWTQYGASVDSDGCRFVVGYTEHYNGVGTDYDTRLSLFANVAGTGLVCQAPRAAAGFDTVPEFGVQVISRYSGGGARSIYAGVWSQSNSTDTSIEAQLFEGLLSSGGFALRPTACGPNAAIGWYGNPSLGEEFVVYQFLGVGPRGYFFGLPTSIPLPFCPGCTIGAQGVSLTIDPLTVTVPCDTSLSGVTVAIQGFHGSGGPCFGAISLSDTLDITIR